MQYVVCSKKQNVVCSKQQVVGTYCGMKFPTGWNMWLDGYESKCKQRQAMGWVNCSLLITHYLLLTAYCLLLTTYYLLLTTYY